MLMTKVANVCLLAMAVSNITVSAAFWSVSDQEAVAPPDDTPKTPDEPVEYGVDVSFPMHYASVSSNYPWLEHNVNPNVPTPKEYEDMVPQPLGNRQQFYKEYLDSCRESFGTKGSRRCTSNELDRIAMTLRQPQSMQNYTGVGYKSKWMNVYVFYQIRYFRQS
jgi:prolyl 4-hydroxylase